jgi:hypothetical protein
VRAKGSSSPKKKSGARLPGPSKDSVSDMSPKEAAFIREHWPPQGRAERIARAEQAWKEIREIASTFKKLDAEMLKWIAEDPDLKYL